MTKRRNYARAGDPPFTNETVHGQVCGVAYRNLGDLLAVHIVEDERDRKAVILARWHVNRRGVWVRQTKGVTIYASELLDVTEAFERTVESLMPL